MRSASSHRQLAFALAAAALASCGDGAEKEKPPPKPYGLTERVDNTACILETVDGAGIITVAPALSATGCYEDLVAKVPHAGLLPFDIRVPLWTDGAHKRRFFGLPPGTTIGFTEDGAWEFPVGTVFMKEFILERVVGDPGSRVLLETRFFIRAATKWRGYSYRWNDASTDAVLLEGGEIGTYEVVESGVARQHTHDFPSRTECLRCHPRDAGSVLGLQTSQMNRDYEYGEVVDNQIRAFNHIGLFDQDVEARLTRMAALPSPEDTSLSLETRSRAILMANCGHCHQPQGSAVSALIRDLRFNTALADTFVCDQVVPGSAAASNLWQQIDSLDMPPIATHSFDPRLDVVRAWIDSMTQCP